MSATIAEAIANKNIEITQQGDNLDIILTALEGKAGFGEGTDTSDATAVAADLVAGKTAYSNMGKITGTREKVSQLTTSTCLNEPTMSFLDGGLRTSAALNKSIAADSGKSVQLVFAADNLGDATAADVIAGKTFTSANGLKLTGTYEETSYITTIKGINFTHSTITLNGSNGESSDFDEYVSEMFSLPLDVWETYDKYKITMPFKVFKAPDGYETFIDLNFIYCYDESQGFSPTLGTLQLAGDDFWILTDINFVTGDDSGFVHFYFDESTIDETAQTIQAGLFFGFRSDITSELGRDGMGLLEITESGDASNSTANNFSSYLQNINLVISYNFL